MNLVHPRTLIGAGLTAASALLLSACGGSSLVSASAVARCAHAQAEAVSNLPQDAPTSLHQVVAKVAPGGWLRQDYSAVEQTERKESDYELYVFRSARAAEEAFNLFSSARNPGEAYGTGGTFRRANVIVNAEGEAGPLTASVETLLNKCVGKGAAQSVIRPSQEVKNGQTRSERLHSEEDGSAPSTSGTSDEAPNTTVPTEPAQEAPASENMPSAGQSRPPAQEGE